MIKKILSSLGIFFILPGWPSASAYGSTQKGKDIYDSLQKGVFNLGSLSVDIVDFEIMAGGIQVFAKAYKNGQQLGFSKDGSVEIERYRVFNPPTLVPDVNGEITKVIVDPVTKEEKLTKFRHDPEGALKIEISEVVLNSGKVSANIVSGKIGRTVSMFYTNAGATNGNDTSMCYYNATSWSDARGQSTANTFLDSSNKTSAGMTWNVSGSNYQICRAGWFIDTSALGTDTINSAYFSLTGTRQTGQDDWHLVKHLSTNDQLASSDYNISLYGSDVASAVDSYSWGSTDTNVDVTITDLSVINTAGYTRLGALMDSDKNNSPLTSLRGVSLYYADDSGAGTTNDPVLVVDHASSGGSSSSSIPMSTSGATIQTSTGSRIILDSYCNSYAPITGEIDTGSGIWTTDSDICDGWTYTITFGALNFFNESLLYQLLYSFGFVSSIFVGFLALFYPIIFIKRIFIPKL